MATYMMARFENRQMLAEASTKLDQFNEIKRWDAVDGYYQMILKLSGEKNLEAEISANLSGILEITGCKIMKDNEPDQPFDNELCHSYLLIETDIDKEDEVQKQVSAFDKTLFCNLTKGKYDLVAILAGNNFDTLDRIINDKISHLDGIIRVKQDRIISSVRR